MSRSVSDVLKVGDTAPGFILPNHRGETRSLGRALASGPVLLGFHRGTW